MKFFIYLSPFIFLLLLAATVIECNNNLLCPYDMIHNYIMYAQKLVRAKGLKEWQTLFLTIIIIHILTGII